jgi:predicted transcriptional regulator
MLRRSREEILYEILKSCSSDKLSIYQLMVSLNLSHKSLKSCLDQLATSKLITIDIEEKRRAVSTTQDGMEAVSLYRKAISSLKRR